MTIGVLFTLIALVALVTLLRLKSLADTADQQVNVNNTNPVLDTIVVSESSLGSQITTSTGFTPNEGTTKTIYVHGTAHDDNGCEDIATIDLTLYRAGIAGAETCAADDNNCYKKTLTTSDFTGCTGAGDNNLAFETTFNVANFVDPTDSGPYAATNWVNWGKVTDDSAGTGTNSDVWGVNSLAAFSVYTTSTGATLLNYNSVALGATSPEGTVNFVNTGNRDVNSNVLANGDMTSNLSGYSDIPSTATRYSTSTGFASMDGYAVQKGVGNDTLLDIHLPQQTTSSAPERPSYWHINMPASGVNGTYTNTLTLTAVAY